VARTYRFGPFTFDAARRRLSRDGQAIAVSPKALDVLDALLAHRGRTVEKDDLIGRVWPDTVVEEANLTQSIFMLRRALGDDPSASRYIATVARRGYRFVAAASERDDEGPAPERRHLHHTANLEAYHAYVKGRHYWSKRDADGVRAAIALFRQAIDLDPTYALAYVGLAECFLVLRVHCWPSPVDGFAMARAAAMKALQIDDTIAEAHAALGLIQVVSEWDWDAAERSFRYAIDLAPDHPTTRNWYANCLAARGHLDDAIREAREAVRLDPLNLTWHLGVGHMLFLARRFEEAIDAELNVLEIDPQFWLAYWILGMAYEQTGERARAVAALRRGDDLSSGNLIIRGLLGRILALDGSDNEARRLLDDLTGRQGRETAPAELTGLVHAGLGDLDGAFDCFERAARDGSYLLAFLRVSPLFDSLRSHQRFGPLLGLTRLG
jgi:DNA-binding winged helix-turn-helix (wHTH) protein/Flp pilus assembly protein TadD